MIVNNAKYELTAVRPDQYPQKVLPEVAFVGRSNVGKSSLINSLLNRKNLARVGAAPGKTRQINFFNIDDKVYFVDLPGYGYAKVSKSERTSWGKLADTYLTTREQLKLILMLVDIRHKPSQLDCMMYEWICDSDFPHIIVSTKADKVSRSSLKGRVVEIGEELGITNDTRIIPFSSLKKTGIEELWQEIDSILK